MILPHQMHKAPFNIYIQRHFQILLIRYKKNDFDIKQSTYVIYQVLFFWKYKDFEKFGICCFLDLFCKGLWIIIG